MEVGLGDSGVAGETALGSGTAVNAASEFVDESILQVVEVHLVPVRPISRRNRVLMNYLRTDVILK